MVRRAHPRKVLASLRSAIFSGLALLLPLRCAGCGAPDLALCPACRIQLEQPVQRHDLRGVPVWSAASYEGVVAHAITAFKDEGATAHATALAAALRRALAEAVAHLSGDWEADIAAYDAARGHILDMADVLSAGIISQFPESFS